MNFVLPASWASLTDRQLRFVFAQLARRRTAIDIQTRCFFRWTKLRVIDHLNDGRFIVCTADRRHRHVPLRAAQLQPAIATLRWMDTPPPMPVRITRIGRHRAIAADFQEVPFRVFIFCDNLYQGFLQTKSFELLRQMAQIMYGSQRLKPDEAGLLSVFYWFTSLKTMFSRRFHHFLQPARKPSGNLLVAPSIADRLQESMDAQIRALTGGDITKESQILGMDTWRALTELDAKARDYEQMKKQYQ